MAGKTRVLLLALFAMLLATQSAFALDEEALCTGANKHWNHMLYQCTIDEVGQNPSGIDYNYHVGYPTRVMDEAFIQSAIDTLLQGQITSFLNDVAGVPSSPGELYLLIDYDIFEFDQNVFSVVFHIEIYMAGAHPNYFVQTLTFDREHNQLLNLPDLFVTGSDPLALIVPFVQAELTTVLGSDPATVQGIEAGTTPDFANFQAFAVTNDGVIFFFPPYQVAPFAAGGQTVYMPISSLASLWQIGPNAHPIRKG